MNKKRSKSSDSSRSEFNTREHLFLVLSNSSAASQFKWKHKMNRIKMDAKRKEEGKNRLEI